MAEQEISSRLARRLELLTAISNGEAEVKSRREENESLSNQIQDNHRLSSALRRNLDAWRRELAEIESQVSIATTQQLAAQAQQAAEDRLAKAAEIHADAEKQSAELAEKNRRADELLAKLAAKDAS